MHRLSAAAVLQLPHDGTGGGDFKRFEVSTYGAPATCRTRQSEATKNPAYRIGSNQFHQDQLRPRPFEGLDTAVKQTTSDLRTAL